MASSPLSRMPFSAKFPPAFRSCIAAPKPSLGSLSPVFTGGSQVRCVSVQMSSVQRAFLLDSDLG